MRSLKKTKTLKSRRKGVVVSPEKKNKRLLPQRKNKKTSVNAPNRLSSTGIRNPNVENLPTRIKNAWSWGVVPGEVFVFLAAFVNGAVWLRTSSAVIGQQAEFYGPDRSGIHAPLSRVLGIILEFFGNNIWRYLLRPEGYRLVSVLLVAGSAVMLYSVSRKLFWKRSSLIMALCFAMGFWVFMASKFYGFAAETLFATSLVMLCLTFARMKDSKFWLYGLALAMVYAIYVPYGILIVLTVLIISWPELRKYARNNGYKSVAIPAIGGLVLLAPLIAMLAVGRADIADLMPTFDQTQSASEAFKRGLGSVLGLGLRGREDWQYALGVTPMMNIMIAACMVVGALHLCGNVLSHRMRLIAATFVLPIVICMLDQGRNYQILFLPVAILLSSLGLEVMMREWSNTFPRNKIAVAVGMTPTFILLFIGVGVDQFKAQRAFSLSPRVIENYPLVIDEVQNRDEVSSSGPLITGNQNIIDSDNIPSIDPTVDNQPTDGTYYSDRESMLGAKSWLGDNYALTKQYTSDTSKRPELYIFNLKPVE